MLVVYGILFIIIENRNKIIQPTIHDFSQLTYKTAFLIGVFQVLALIPGTSRSGATIIGAMLVGTSRYIAAEFTFFLAILKKSNPKYANIDSELYGRILITLLEGTMLKIKIEKAERPKEDFLAFFDKLFTILNEPN